jgi:hypothetical protein
MGCMSGILVPDGLGGCPEIAVNNRNVRIEQGQTRVPSTETN